MNVKRQASRAGREFVWDYPRPPRVEPCSREIRVVFCETVIAETRRSQRVLETSHPPVYYVPPEDVRFDVLKTNRHSSWCEWKGRARYFDIVLAGRRVENAAWSYPEPNAAFESIRDHVAFYPGRVDACYVDGEAVCSQPGDFYGGWITSDVVGPFKGAPGTAGW